MAGVGHEAQIADSNASPGAVARLPPNLPVCSSVPVLVTMSGLPKWTDVVLPDSDAARPVPQMATVIQNAALFGTLGNGMASRMFSMPVT